jgi:hypothetical protein
VGRKLGIGLTIAAVLLFGAVVSLSRDFFDKLLYAPWALDLDGGPTLEGSWEGTLRARLGAEYRLSLTMQHRDRDGRRRRTRQVTTIEGSARLCAPTGRLYEYTLLGGADDAGEQLRLTLTYPDPSQSALGLRLEARWSEGAPDVLRIVSVATNPFLPDGTFQQVRSIGSSDPDDSFLPAELRRTTGSSEAASCPHR